jgi:2-C-methyl-D-erythritol 2,4-cyclodiphosphate synthase
MQSKFFLKEVNKMITEKGWQIENIDCSLCLEKPKINPHIPAMKQTLAPLMGISEDLISIKATTNERMGYVGREEGVNAYAVVLLRKD